jgi:DNA recombination protein RmuC
VGGEIRMALGVVIILGLAIGGAFGWLLAASHTKSAMEGPLREALAAEAAARAQADSMRNELEARNRDNAELRERIGQAEVAKAELAARETETRKRFEEQQRILAEAESRLSDTFKALAAETLRMTTDDLMKRAAEKFTAEREVAGLDFATRQKAVEELIKPAAESLSKLDEQLRQIEKERSQSQGALRMQLEQLRAQTGKLADALKTPIVRGRWGEVQLRNVVEIAGMSEHCDFDEQASLTVDGARLRPDMVVRLPGGKNVVVDSKAPLKAYLEALDAVDEAARTVKLKEHAAQIRKHVEQLSSKAYWDACKSTPEFVVLFLPGEMFFSAALQQDPSLMEDAWAKKVILATPTTLMAVLRSVAYAWRQEQLAENAQRISALGQELHERIATMTGYISDLGGALDRAVKAYNQTVSSMETRVLVTGRKFKDLGVASKKEIGELKQIESAPREPAKNIAEPFALNVDEN